MRTHTEVTLLFFQRPSQSPKEEGIEDGPQTRSPRSTVTSRRLSPPELSEGLLGEGKKNFTSTAVQGAVVAAAHLIAGDEALIEGEDDVKSVTPPDPEVRRGRDRASVADAPRSRDRIAQQQGDAAATSPDTGGDVQVEVPAAEVSAVPGVGQTERLRGEASAVSSAAECENQAEMRGSHAAATSSAAEQSDSFIVNSGRWGGDDEDSLASESGSSGGMSEEVSVLIAFFHFRCV